MSGYEKDMDHSNACILCRLPPSDLIILQAQNSSRPRAWTSSLLVLGWWMIGGIHKEENKSQKLYMYYMLFVHCKSLNGYALSVDRYAALFSVAIVLLCRVHMPPCNECNVSVNGMAKAFLAFLPLHHNCLKSVSNSLVLFTNLLSF